MNYTQELQKLSLEEMKTLLAGLREYDEMRHKLGQRGVELFKNKLSGKKVYVVEYFPALGENDAYSQSEKIFKKSFNLTPDKNEIVFLPSEDIKGGMKVYVDDSMVDMSFKNIENKMQK